MLARTASSHGVRLREVIPEGSGEEEEEEEASFSLSSSSTGVWVLPAEYTVGFYALLGSTVDKGSSVPEAFWDDFHTAST